MKQHKKFLMMWAGQLISNIGGGLTAFVLGIHVFKITNSATYYSLLILTAWLPSILLRPIGGTLSDRIDRRTLMILGDLGAAIGVGFTLGMMLLGIKTLWPIYVGAFISSIFVAFHNPAYKASVTDLVDEAFFSKASGLMQLAEASKILISPILASGLFLFMNVHHILMLDICTFMVGIVPVWWLKRQNVHPVSANKESFTKDLLLGFQYLTKHQAILWLLFITSLITFFVGALQALWAPLILATSNVKILGVAQTIATSGMLAGGGLLGIFGQSGKKSKILSMSLLVSGLFLSLMGISSQVTIITCFGFMFFLTLPLVNTSIDVLIRSNVNNHMQGRIWSIVSLISQSGMLIAFAIAGYLSDHFFSPLLMPNGILSATIGKIIGVGPGRGIGFMFIIFGVMIMCIAPLLNHSKMVRSLEN